MGISVWTPALKAQAIYMKSHNAEFKSTPKQGGGKSRHVVSGGSQGRKTILARHGSLQTGQCLISWEVVQGTTWGRLNSRVPWRGGKPTDLSTVEKSVGAGGAQRQHEASEATGWPGARLVPLGQRQEVSEVWGPVSKHSSSNTHVLCYRRYMSGFRTAPPIRWDSFSLSVYGLRTSNWDGFFVLVQQQ